MSSSSYTLKIALVGPARSGKSLIANQIDGRPQLDIHSNPNTPTEYSPTAGCRILTFTEPLSVPSPDKSSRSADITVNVELWDTSGDPQYENTWPCVSNRLHGAIVVFDPTSKEQANEVRPFCDRIARMANLESGQLAIFAHGELSQTHKPLTVKDKTVVAPILNVSSKQSPSMDENGGKVPCPAKKEFRSVLLQCFMATQNTETLFM